jgi:hypothetical protein
MLLASMAEARAEGKPATFSSTGMAHAGVVLDVMIDDSSRSLDVISGFLNSSAWSSESLRRFLRRGGTLRVLLDEVPDGEIPRNSALWDIQHEKRVEVRQLRERLDMHLCIADGQHVRLEHEQRLCEATVTFNDKGFGFTATAVFESAWQDQSVPLRELA